MAAGQTLNDRMLAARHSLAGQGLAKAVCKATTEELMGPKRKHLEYLLRCTEEPNVSIPTLANLLLERTQNQNWIVVFKSLVTLHHLMCYGNERFTQFLASSNTNFQLSQFLDKSGVQGYDMSPFVRRYAKYLSEKSVSYRTVAFDFCKVKRGKDGGALRSMTAEKLLKTLPVLHDQIDALLEFDAGPQDLNNGVINAAFVLLFKDLIRLFACCNDGIINLLEKYFDMNRKNAKDALDIYKKFLIRMDRVAEFLKVAENMGMDRSDLPDLTKAPSSLLEALESHLANLEGRKGSSNATSPTGAPRVNVASAVNALSSTSSSFGSAAAGSAIDEKLQKQLLAEEEQAMAKYKENAGKGSNPFFTSGGDPGQASAEPAAKVESGNGATPNILDLFGMSGGAPSAPEAGTTTSAAQASSANKASDDLLQLSGGNPFASVLSAAGGTTTTSAQQPPAAGGAFGSPFAAEFSNANGGTFVNGPVANPHMHPAFPSNQGLFGQPSHSILSPSFGSDASFTNAFGNTVGPTRTPSSNAVGADFFGDILQPQSGAANGGGQGAMGMASSNAAVPQDKLVSGDLDASLANLTSNLNLTSGQSNTTQQPLSNARSRGGGGLPMAAVGSAGVRQPLF